MSALIAACELQPGDLYRPTMFGAATRGQVFHVQAARTIVSGASYRVIEAVNVCTGSPASIDLRADVTVARLVEVDRRDVAAALDTTADGEQLALVRHDGKWWW